MPVLVFGGRPLLEKYKITSLKRGMMVALVPCQVKFVHEQKPNLNWHRSGHLVGLLLFGYAVHMGLHHIPGCMDIIRAVVFLEAEVLAIIIASFLLLLDIPGHVWQIGMDVIFFFTADSDWRVQVILPYGAVYLSTSSRDFWRKWSRPAGQLIRFMVYYPLGGSARPYISIPVMFSSNAFAHFAVSFALVNDWAIPWWLAVFGILGYAVTIEVFADKWMVKRYESENAFPFWYKIIRTLVAVASLRTALYIFVHNCLKLDITSF